MNRIEFILEAQAISLQEACLEIIGYDPLDNGLVMTESEAFELLGEYNNGILRDDRYQPLPTEETE